MQRAHERKSRKYEELLLEAEQNGWRIELWPIEIGCRGFLQQHTPQGSRSNWWWAQG